MAQEQGESAKGTSAIGNLLEVLRCFTLQEPLLGVTEIAAQVGLHKSSVSRILANLEEEHIVERDAPSRKYRLGTGLIDVAGPLLAGLDVRRVALPAMAQLVEETGETAVLTTWNGAWSTCVEQIPSPKLIKHTSPLGQRYTTAASATVQIVLAYEDDAVVDRLLDDAALTLPPGMQRPEYLASLERTRIAGVAINDGETSDDELGIAAPVWDHRGEMSAALLIAAPRYRVGPAEVERFAELAVAAANEVSRRMGFVGERIGA